MVSVKSARALRDCGLENDRYCMKKGFWKVTEACQVTLITDDDVNKAKQHKHANFAHGLEQGSHRRNLVIAGIKTKILQGTDFRIGSAIFRYHKPRPPCGYLDSIEAKGLSRILAKHSGACIQVIKSGYLSVGDKLEILKSQAL